MQSKFTPIAKVRKQQRDMVETRLAKARYENMNLSLNLALHVKR